MYWPLYYHDLILTGAAHVIYKPRAAEQAVSPDLLALAAQQQRRTLADGCLSLVMLLYSTVSGCHAAASAGRQPFLPVLESSLLTRPGPAQTAGAPLGSLSCASAAAQGLELPCVPSLFAQSIYSA